MESFKKAFLLLWITNLTTSAQVVFQETIIEQNVDPAAKIVPFQYSFRIEGKKAVQIRSVEASCSCQVPEIDGGYERVWQPGETGSITVNVNTGLMTGTMRKSVRVISDDQSSQKLTQVVKIKEALTVTPKTHRWKIGAPIDEKVFLIETNKDENITISNVISSNPDFAFRLEHIGILENGKTQYKLFLTPNSSEKKMFCVVKVETNSEIPRYSRFSLFAIIDDKGPLK